MKIRRSMLLAICGLFVIVGSAFAQTWTLTGAPTNNFWPGPQSIASSADGSKLAACYNDFEVYPAHYVIYTSTDSGATWTSRITLTNWGWFSVASSADGNRLVAASWEFGIYVSTNSGVDWIQTSAPTNILWTSVASSADGSRLVAAAGTALNYVGPIYVSTNSAATWTPTSAPIMSWVSVASSADGNKLVAAACIGPIYTSADGGITWTQTSAPNTNWVSVTSAADGNKLAAAQYFSGADDSFIYTSADSGASWTVHYFSPDIAHGWQGIASSADGNKLVAVTQGPIFTSTDSGTTWVSNNAPAQIYWCAASSADGSRLVAGSIGDLGNPLGGGIYASQTTPAPQLQLAPSVGNLTASWIVPSTNFVLQQSLDLSSWMDVTNSSVLNLTNLQEEVVLSPTNSSGFYRLKTP